jgi:hypothetical protein
VPISFGASGQFVHSEWVANLDTELTTSLDAQIRALGQDPGYTDAQIEDQDYAGNLDFGKLTDDTFTFSGGLRADLDPFKISVAYVHGVSVNNTGDVTMHLHCPPTTDTLGRFGAEAYGLCYPDPRACRAPSAMPRTTTSPCSSWAPTCCGARTGTSTSP